MPNDSILAHKERSAWRAFFYGAKNIVTQYSNRPDDVNFGKYECECVPFEDFWLGKLVDMGYITVETSEPMVAKWYECGTVMYINYKITVTDIGLENR